MVWFSRKKRGKKMKRLLLAALVVFFSGLLFGCGDVSNESEVEDVKILEIPISELSETTSFYEFRDGDVTIKFLAVLGSEGMPRTAVDACDVCGGYRGYRQVGSDIMCINCGRYFKIDGLGTENMGYGCWPSYLPHEIENGKILIKSTDLVKHRSKFAAEG